MEDGRLTDSSGRVVSFKDSLMILTSNVGSRVIAKGGYGQIGFQLEEGSQAAGAGSSQRLHALVHEELKQHFRPELLNRLDEIVVRCHCSLTYMMLCRLCSHTFR
jgi:ATP-dependent Clp protease ATP-binding subunit ClpC